MPNFQDRSFAHFDAMSDDELQQILREDASKPEGEDTDMEQLLYIMEVLAKRRNQRSEGRSPAEALESFHKNYCTVYDNHLISDTEEKHARKLTFRPWLRVSAAAAILVVILSIPLGTDARNFNLWNILVQWTQETFHFRPSDATESTEPEVVDSVAYAGLRDALDKLSIPTTLIPTWLPDGYEETKVEIYENPLQRRVYAEYLTDMDLISIRITDHLGQDPMQTEQSGSLLEVYPLDGIDYYIFENHDRLSATWIIQSYECQIYCTTSVDDIKLMIDSIGSIDSDEQG